MSGYRRIQTGGSDRIVTAVLHAGDPSSPLIGLTTVVLSIWRMNGVTVEWYDFNDSTFKAAGWTTLQQVMTALDATRAPGVYQYLWTTVSITNPNVNDTYFYRVTDTSLQARNVPQEGVLDVGQYIDNLDATVSSRASAVALAAVQADTDDIQTRLPATLNAGRMRSHVEVMDIDVIGASQIAAGAIGVSEAPLLANLDAAVSTRAAPGDAMALTSAERLAIDAELSTAHGAGAWDGTVAPALVAAAVWDEVKAGHVAPGSFGEEEQSHATPTEVLAAVGLGLVAYDASTGTQVASRAAPGDAMDLIADAVDANALAADAIAEIDAELSSVHGAGSWEDAPAPPSKTTLVMVDESIGVLV